LTRRSRGGKIGGMGPITFVRNIDAHEFFESFLVSAVASILAIRAFLHLAGYPTVGGDALHIAHMLWGGLLMLIALALLLGFLGKQVKSAAAVIGGVGWGTFIDELGKFLTHDNDYFWEPTVALIYVLFVLLYVATMVVQRSPPSREESVANALEIMLEAVRRDLDPRERERAEELLKQAAPDDPVGQALAAALRQVEGVAAPSPGPLMRARLLVRASYARVVKMPWFPRLVVAFFVANALIGFGQMVLLLGRQVGELTVFNWIELVLSLVPVLFVVAGVVRMPRSRLAAYQMFHAAVLVIIFVTQFFAFYHHQFTAVAGLFANLIVLATLRYMIHEEASYVKRVVV
jgi:hypothetical protein